MKTADYIKCRCRNCDKPIEFDSAESGATVSCPHCGLETLLFIPASSATVPSPAAWAFHFPPAPAKSVRDRKSGPTLAGPILLAVFGLGLIVFGCANEAASKNAMNQIYAAIQYCTGLLLIAAALLLDGLRNITRNQ